MGPLRQRVLIVEDNADLRRLYAISLNQHGFQVKLAANGAEALNRVEAERPDLILLDLIMPIMDGWEVIDKVNPPEKTEEPIPVIVLTGHSLAPDRPLPPCIIGWMTKPAVMEEIVAVIDRKFSGPPPSVPNGHSPLSWV